MPISQRQKNIRDSIISKRGVPKQGFKDLAEILSMFVYSDIELDIIQRNIIDADKNKARKKKEIEEFKIRAQKGKK